MKAAAVARSGAWLAADNASAAVISFLFFVVTARVLPLHDFAVAALALSVIQILGPLVETLFNDAIVQKRNLTDRHISSATYASIVWGLVIFGLNWLLAPFIASLTHAPDLTAYLRWIGLAVVFSGIGAAPSAMARRDMNFRILALRTMLARTIATLVGLWMVWRGYGVWAIVVQFVLSAALSAAFVLIAKPLKLASGFSLALLKELLAFAAPAVGTQMLFFANSRLVTLIMGATVGPAGVGLWQIAVKFVEPVQLLLATTIGQLSLPLFARRQTERAVIGDMFVTATRYASALVAPALIGMALCAKQIITVFVGARWVGAEPLMQIVAMVAMIILLRQLAETAMSAIGRPKLNFWVHSQGAILSLIGMAVGAAMGGVLGGVLGWAVRIVPFLLTYGVYLKTEAHLSFRRQFAPNMPSLIASLPMGAAVLLAEYFAAPLHLNPIILLVASIATGGAIYLAALLMLDSRLRQDLIRLVRPEPAEAEVEA